MARWVEELLGDNVRIVAILDEAPRPERPVLTYVVMQRGADDRGPFESFDDAMEVATHLASSQAA